MDVSEDGRHIGVGASNGPFAYYRNDSNVFVENGSFGGQSIAISDDGNTLATGVVAVFVRNTTDNTWIFEQQFQGSNTEEGDLFGRKLALSSDGNTLIVSAFLERSAATTINGDGSDNSLAGAGAVYVFTREAGVWSQQAYIKHSRNKPRANGFGTRFGSALSYHGDVLAVGYESDEHGVGVNDPDVFRTEAYRDSGAVVLFRRNGTTWTEGEFVKSTNSRGGDMFGHSAVVVKSNTLVVSSQRESSTQAADQTQTSQFFVGAVYDYTFIQENKQEIPVLKASGESCPKFSSS